MSLNAADLAYMRQTALETTLTERAIVCHSELVDDGYGGQIPVLTYTPDIPCRVGVSRLVRGELLEAGQLRGSLPWLVTLPAGTVVDLTDTINVGGTLTGAPPSETIEGGRTFEVLAIYAAWTNETARQCVCGER